MFLGISTPGFEWKELLLKVSSGQNPEKSLFLSLIRRFPLAIASTRSHYNHSRLSTPICLE